MPRRRLTVLLASALLLVQTLSIAVLKGTTAAALISDFVQVGLGLTCCWTSFQAGARSARASSFHWTWLAVSFVAYTFAQSLGTYIDATSNHAWDRLDDMVFSLSVIPIAMLPFVDPDREPSRFDRLHVLDFVQISCFWLAVYLYFRNTPGLSLATVGWEGFGWSSALVFHAILTLSFVLGAVLGRSRDTLSFFGGMAAYVFLAGLADSYASLPANGVQPGQWFDLVWSLLMVIPLGMALAWKQDASLIPPPAARIGRIVLSHLFPLVYPFFAVLLLIHDASRNPRMCSVMTMIVFVALAVRIVIAQDRLLRAQDSLAYEATHDALTGTPNRAAILQILEKELLRQQRSNERFTVMLVDIDHFKSINDTHGHIVGDQVLTGVAQRLTGSTRGGDSVGRYGGEEFLIILPNCGVNGAAMAAERFRSCIADLPVTTTGGAIPVSVSIGFVTACGGNSAPSYLPLLHMADDALYQAKAKGRNRVQQSMPSLDAGSSALPEASHASVASS
jgi:diguanylate cyclase (GGDEF)-like protein